MKVLWVGPLADSEQVTRCPAISAAAVNWQRSMIKAFSDLGCHVHALSYITESSFPKGSFIAELPQFSSNSIQSIPIQYINVSGVREYSLLTSAKVALKRYYPIDVVITYNERPAHTLLAQYLRKRQKTYWVTIVADGNFTFGADLYVFLSYQYYKNAKVKNKIHIDGGINLLETHDFKILTNNQPKTLLFNGSFTKWTGIENFAVDFARINFPGFILKITGRGESDVINKLTLENKNIILPGFLNDSDLHLERQNAFAFVNPRPVDIEMGERNFPSKILEYLAYCKPILSTKTSSLSPCYDDLLFYYSEKNIISLRENLEKLFLLSLNIDNLISLQERLMFFCESHTWNRQVEKILKRLFEYGYT
jgi:hypothetical protein